MQGPQIRTSKLLWSLLLIQRPVTDTTSILSI